MGKIVYHQFLGSQFFVVLLCLTVVGIPMAILYAVQCTVTVIEETPNPSKFLEKWKSEHTFLGRIFSR